MYRHAAADHPGIRVSAPASLADQAIDVSVTGLAAAQRVTITAQSSDDAHRVWRAQGTYTASQDGMVDLALGGTRAADLAAQRASWALVLGQLARLGG